MALRQQTKPGLWIWVVAMTVSFGMGLWGWWDLKGPGKWREWADILYMTCQFFVFEADVKHTAKWHPILHLARFAAPISLIIPPFIAFLPTLKEQFSQFRLRKLKGHVLICGVDEGNGDAYRLAEQFLKHHDSGSVLCIVSDGKGDEIRDLSGRGARVLLGEPTQDATLKQAGAKEAKDVVIITGTTATNARIVRSLEEAVQARQREGRLRCYVESTDGTIETEQDSGLIGRSPDMMELHPFSIPRGAARRLLEHHPPWEHRLPAQPDDPALHVLVVGFGTLGREVVKQVIRLCHFADDQDVRVTIVASDSAVAVDRFKNTDAPDWRRVADLRFHHKDPLSVGTDEWDEWQRGGAFDAIYVALDEPAGEAGIDGLRVAAELKRTLGLKDRPSTIVAYSFDESEDVPPGAGPTLFSLTREAVTIESVIRESNDKLAQHIHDFYEKQYGGDTPWEALGTDLRDANRDQADHLWAKLAISQLADPVQLAQAHRALARARRSPDEASRDLDTPLKIVRALMSDTEQMARLNKPTADKPNPAYDEPLVERLARVEHRRWMASKIMARWQHGETRNDRLRRHNCLVDYDALSEVNKEKDRDTARTVPTLLEMAVKALSGS